MWSSTANVMLVVFIYLIGVRFLWVMIAALWYCCPTCAAMTRTCTRCLFFMLTFLVAGVGIAIIEVPQARVYAISLGQKALGANNTASLAVSGALSTLTSQLTALQSANTTATASTALNNLGGFGTTLGDALLKAGGFASGWTIMRGLVWTTISLFYVIPCLCNCSVLCSFCMNPVRFVDWIN